MRCLLVLAVAVAPAAAFAGSEAPSGAEGDEERRGRVGASLHLSSGARAVFPYDGEYCGRSGAYCLGRVPARADLGVSVAVLPRLALLGAVQLGIEKDFGTSAGASGPRVVAIAPGVLARVGEAGPLAFATTAQLAIDLTGYEQASGADLALRNENRLVFELAELGAGATLSGYAFFAETIGWRRWLRFELDGGLGVIAHVL